AIESTRHNKNTSENWKTGQSQNPIDIHQCISRSLLLFFGGGDGVVVVFDGGGGGVVVVLFAIFAFLFLFDSTSSIMESVLDLDVLSDCVDDRRRFSRQEYKTKTAIKMVKTAPAEQHNTKMRNNGLRIRRSSDLWFDLEGISQRDFGDRFLNYKSGAVVEFVIRRLVEWWQKDKKKVVTFFTMDFCCSSSVMHNRKLDGIFCSPLEVVV
uniref:Uncharacterized protein n=1 Tax=Romanomermis culicivorax TaxID=13658 RepID=A0A915JYQ1_ROMCU